MPKDFKQKVVTQKVLLARLAMRKEFAAARTRFSIMFFHSKRRKTRTKRVDETTVEPDDADNSDNALLSLIGNNV